MSTTEMPKSLFEALARFQADLPKIAKGETANVPTKQGGSYSYKYADLTDVSEAVLPRLGPLGMAFIAKPTTREDGKFGLAYSLVHVSGDHEDGFYEIDTRGMTPQQTGGLITYARRYCLCAVTGTAPGGDDDDAQSAQKFAVTRQQAADAFENAAPARPRTPAGNGNGSRPSNQGPRSAEEQTVDHDAQKFADEAHTITTPRGMEDVHRRAREAGKVSAYIRNPSSGGLGKLAVYLDWRSKQVRAAVQLSPDDSWAPKVEELDSTASADSALDEVARMLDAGAIDADRAGRIENAIIARFPDAGRDELAAVS